MFSGHMVIGILGGMGPEATVDFYHYILQETPASRDQDHIPTLIFSNTKVPDRTESIYSGDSGEIVRILREGARVLERAGADFIVMPCNSAHTYYSEISSSVALPVLHMIRETVSHLVEKNPGIKRVGLLATSGTLKTGLYQDILKQHDIEAVVPDASVQETCVMKAIYTIIKAGKDPRTAEKMFMSSIRSLPDDAQKTVIMGCTEIPLALQRAHPGVTLVNPAKILAGKAVRKCMKID